MPESMLITDELDLPAYHRSFGMGGFSDIRQGQYEDRTVLVKIMRVPVGVHFEKIKKVSRNHVFVTGALTSRLPPAIL